MIKSERRPGLVEAAEDVTVFLKPLIKSPKIEVGEFTYYNDTENAAGFEDSNVLYAYGPERLVIGKFCCLAMGTKFIMSPGTDYHMPGGTTSYPFFIFGGSWLEKTADLLPSLPSKGDIVVGNDVWIGREAVIMPGVTIGDGAVIGARSLVTSDVAPYTVVGGNPAKEIKKRLPDEDIRPHAAHRLVGLARRGRHRARAHHLVWNPVGTGGTGQKDRPSGKVTDGSAAGPAQEDLRTLSPQAEAARLQ
ncbi:CatB-related O-acetyltransferase [Streptomyces tendae]|uniref:CatB-related O-acetyltransferase n=1 Tax=Streptomyces tendae TaxID=1932 RepID=A0ABX6A258_STRTE|nr:CatB-related O-acetyltransferase [Streptomyces tendae]